MSRVIGVRQAESGALILRGSESSSQAPVIEHEAQFTGACRQHDRGLPNCKADEK